MPELDGVTVRAELLTLAAEAGGVDALVARIADAARAHLGDNYTAEAGPEWRTAVDEVIDLMLDRARTVTGRRSVVARAIEAEARGIEENHHARWDVANGRVVVISDTDDELAYSVSAVGHSDGGVVFRCQPIDRASGSPVERTHRLVVGESHGVPCKHATRLARRLEREGLLEWVDGVGWSVPPAICWAIADEHRVADPFATFPKL